MTSHKNKNHGISFEVPTSNFTAQSVCQSSSKLSRRICCKSYCILQTTPFLCGQNFWFMYWKSGVNWFFVLHCPPAPLITGEVHCIPIILRWRRPWFGHVERTDDADWVKWCMLMETEKIRQRGRQKKTRWDCVRGDMESFGI